MTQKTGYPFSASLLLMRLCVILSSGLTPLAQISLLFPYLTCKASCVCNFIAD